jgi:hypothetical protein
MPKNRFFSEVKKTALYSLGVFVVLGAVFLAISLQIQSNENQNQKDQIMNNEESITSIERMIITNKITRMVSDVLYISDTLEIGESGPGYLAPLEKAWMAFSDRKKIYDQIRFIDADGNELIRVNYSEEGAYLTKQEDLQNKKDRYYFTDTIGLEKGQV